MLVEEKMDSVSAANEKSIGTDAKLSLRAKLSYGLGDMASNLCLALTSTYLMFFYTDIYMLPVAALGTIFLISRIISAAFDPVMGYMIDKTNTKYGRARPYILWFCVPLALLTVLIFTTPELSSSGKIAFAFIVYILWGLVYSMVNIPYGTMMSLMTHDSNEKMQLGSLRMLGMSLGQAIVTVSMVPLVNKIGSGNNKIGYLGAAIFFSAIMLVLFYIVFCNCREKISTHNAPIVSKKTTTIGIKLKEAVTGLKEICKNTPWLVSVAIALTSFIRFGAMIPVTIYFCNYYLNEPELASVILPLTSLAPAVSALMAPTFFRKFGIRLGNTYAIIIGIALYLLIGHFENNRMVFMVIYTVSMIFSMLPMVSMWTIIANSADYHQWKFNKRMDAQLYAWNSFSSKIGLALGASFLGWGLAYINYNPLNITAEVSTGLGQAFYYCPVIIMLAQLIGVLFYRIDNAYDGIVEELKKINRMHH